MTKLIKLSVYQFIFVSALSSITLGAQPDHTSPNTQYQGIVQDNREKVEENIDTLLSLADFHITETATHREYTKEKGVVKLPDTEWLEHIRWKIHDHKHSPERKKVDDLIRLLGSLGSAAKGMQSLESKKNIGGNTPFIELVIVSLDLLKEEAKLEDIDIVETSPLDLVTLYKDSNTEKLNLTQEASEALRRIIESSKSGKNLKSVNEKIIEKGS